MLALVFASCAEDKRINDKVYEPYGFFNEEAKKNDSIVYQVSPGSVICAILF